MHQTQPICSNSSQYFSSAFIIQGKCAGLPCVLLLFNISTVLCHLSRLSFFGGMKAVDRSQHQRQSSINQNILSHSREERGKATPVLNAWMCEFAVRKCTHYEGRLR